MHMPVNQPYVGNAAFAHKGGIHVSAIMKDARTYEHTKPEFVGNKQRVLVSELAGQSNVLVKAQELNLDFNKEHRKPKKSSRRLKIWSIKAINSKVPMQHLSSCCAKHSKDSKRFSHLESFKMLVEKTANQSRRLRSHRQSKGSWRNDLYCG